MMNDKSPNKSNSTLGKRMKLKLCAFCGTEFLGEHWKPMCLECYKSQRTEQTRIDARSRGTKIMAPIDARRKGVVKARRRMKIKLSGGSVWHDA